MSCKRSFCQGQLDCGEGSASDCQLYATLPQDEESLHCFYQNDWRSHCAIFVGSLISIEQFKRIKSQRKSNDKDISLRSNVVITLSLNNISHWIVYKNILGSFFQKTTASTKEMCSIKGKEIISAESRYSINRSTDEETVMCKLGTYSMQICCIPDYIITCPVDLRTLIMFEGSNSESLFVLLTSIKVSAREPSSETSIELAISPSMNMDKSNYKIYILESFVSPSIDSTSETHIEMTMYPSMKGEESNLKIYRTQLSLYLGMDSQELDEIDILVQFSSVNIDISIFAQPRICVLTIQTGHGYNSKENVKYKLPNEKHDFNKDLRWDNETRLFGINMFSISFEYLCILNTTVSQFITYQALSGEENRTSQFTNIWFRICLLVIFKPFRNGFKFYINTYFTGNHFGHFGKIEAESSAENGFRAETSHLSSGSLDKSSNDVEHDRNEETSDEIIKAFLKQVYSKILPTSIENVEYSINNPLNNSAMKKTAFETPYKNPPVYVCEKSKKVAMLRELCLYRAHEDCFVINKCHKVQDEETGKTHLIKTQNSVHTVSRNSRMVNLGAKQIRDSEFLTSFDEGISSANWDLSGKHSAEDVFYSHKIYQEVPEEQKLLQPPNTDPSNHNYRVRTFVNCRVDNCSVDDVCKAGFYLVENNYVCCFKCQVRIPIQEFYPRNPSHPIWHRRPCNETNSITESDGNISDDVRDPPGQRSIYIPSGNDRDERYRLSTFANYPVSTPVSKIYLAKAGFYFTGYFDRVKCFSCGRTVERWAVGDDPTNAKWHKSSCLMQRGIASENIPIQSQFFTASATQGRNQFHVDNRRNTNVNPGYSRDVFEGSRNNISQVPQVRGNVSSSQTPREWRMANVVSSDHRRFLTNIYLNRELDRLASFARWPTGRPNVSPSSLARAGFFYLGDMDRTQCFSCGGVLRNWTPNDDVTAEHRRHFPECQMGQGTETRNVPVPMRPEPREERERNFPCRHPSNPHMRSEATRRDTFDQRWAMGRTASTPDEIAQAGFFFLGDRDRVKCWYCNGGLQNWDYDDAPWVEHAVWFPNCQFLLQMKGQHFVYRHLASKAHLQRPIIAKQEGAAIDLPGAGQALAASVSRSGDVPPNNIRSASQPSATPTIIDPREEVRKRQLHIQNVMRNSEIVKNILAMGFNRNVVEILLEDKLVAGTQVNEEDVYGSMSELLEDVMKKEEELNEEQEQMQTSLEAASAQAGPSSLAPLQSNVSVPSYMVSVGTAPGSGKYNAIFYEDDDDDDSMNMYGSNQEVSKEVTNAEATPTTGSTISNLTDTKSMQEAMANFEEEELCKICFANKADMVFLPCSHMCCCMDCTQAIRQCPLCRTPIERAIKTYMS